MNTAISRTLRILILAVVITGCTVTVSTGPDGSSGSSGSGSSSNGGSGASSGGSSGSGSGVSSLHFGVQYKSAGCQANGKYPDPDCTPGDVIPGVTAADVCVSGYSSTVRNVPQAEKDEDYAEYDIFSHTNGEYEVDHFVSLELGGSNDISNLWPEPADPKPGFHEKDKVENYLHSEVCNGTITLEEAQREIATDWYAVYQQMGN